MALTPPHPALFSLLEKQVITKAEPATMLTWNADAQCELLARIRIRAIMKVGELAECSQSLPLTIDGVTYESPVKVKKSLQDIVEWTYRMCELAMAHDGANIEFSTGTSCPEMYCLPSYSSMVNKCIRDCCGKKPKDCCCENEFSCGRSKPC